MPEKSANDKPYIRKLIVIGASAGGVESLVRVVSELPADFNCPICITIHTSPSSPGRLPEILNRCGPLPAQYAEDGQVLENGKIYIAPPDQHLRIEGSKLRLDRGPLESRTRPAVNPLFRSAARDFDGKTVGVVLSGALNDGTAGLSEIKAAGGISIVQDPSEAIFRGMPDSAIQSHDVDHILKLSEIGQFLANL